MLRLAAARTWVAGVALFWLAAGVGAVLVARGFLGAVCVSGAGPTVAGAAFERAMTRPLVVLEVTQRLPAFWARCESERALGLGWGLPSGTASLEILENSLDS